MHQKLTQLLTLWFGEPHPSEIIDPKIREQWFGKNPEFDQLLTEQFSDAIDLAMQGEFEEAHNEPLGRLAEIVLLDQCSRNIYRDTPKMYSQDAHALDLALKGIELKHDLQLNPYQRLFFYMPFEHAEDKAMQARSVELFTQLQQDADEKFKEHFKLMIDYAVAHKVIIDRFGHFPHRNEILGRGLTPEEAEFLKQPDSSF